MEKSKWGRTVMSQYWQNRHCADCEKHLKSTDDFVKVLKRYWTVQGEKQKMLDNFCLDCAKKKGLLE